MYVLGVIQNQLLHANGENQPPSSINKISMLLLFMEGVTLEIILMTQCFLYLLSVIPIFPLQFLVEFVMALCSPIYKPIVFTPISKNH